MKILITGGCGFIGSNLAVSLVGENYAVTCFDNLSRRGSEILLNRILEHGCKFVHGDIRNEEDFNKLKEDYEVLIECSAEPSAFVGSQGNDAMYVISNNLIGSIHCFEFSRKKKIPILFLSSSRVYPYSLINRFKFEEEETRFEYADAYRGISSKGITVDFPLKGYRSLYGATKLASEYLLQEYSCNYEMPGIINRCGVIAGPWQLGKVDQGVFTYWLVNHYFKKDLCYIGFNGKGKQVRDLLHIDDLVVLIKKQVKQIRNYRGTLFNVGGSTLSSLSLVETTKLCWEITGNRVQISSNPENRPGDVIWYMTDNGNTEKEFDWTPLKEAHNILSDIFEWLRLHEKTFKPLLGN
jgi:CDP-paratose 2-epimerase